RREPGAIEAELLADHPREGVAIDHLGAGDMPEAQELTLAQLDARRRHVGVIRRARMLVDGQAEVPALAAGADQLVDEILLLPLGAVDDAGAEDHASSTSTHDCLLAPDLAP